MTLSELADELDTWDPADLARIGYARVEVTHVKDSERAAYHALCSPGLEIHRIALRVASQDLRRRRWLARQGIYLV